MRTLLLIFCILLLLCGTGVLLVHLHLQVRNASTASLFLRGVHRHRADRLCAPAYLALLLVPSTDQNRRQLIRETWGHPFHTHPLGLSVAFGTVDEVSLEAEMFGDILQLPQPGGTFALMQAAREACGMRKAGPRYLVKSEEGVFVNIFSLVGMLRGLMKQPPAVRRRHAIWCHVWERGFVITDDSSSPGWRVSQVEPPPSPSHCRPGPFVLRVGTADALLFAEHSTNTSNMRVDDAYVTDSLAKEVGVELVQISGWYDHQTIDGSRVLNGQTIFASVKEDAKMESLWNALVENRKRENGL